MKFTCYYLLLSILALSSQKALAASNSLGILDQLSPEVRALVVPLASTTTTTTTSEEEHADLWRRLGKTQLDAREYAEARRIFCHGSNLCPGDEKLRHHVKVFDTFQGNIAGESGKPSSLDSTRLTTSIDSQKAPPPLEISAAMANNPDLFLSLDVPRDKIPVAIKRWKGHVPADDRCRLIHASTVPILSREACQFLIDAAIQSSQHRGGWTKDRHVQAPTCDIPVFDLALPAKQWCRNAMNDCLLPLLAKTVAPELDIDPGKLHIQDCFIVRYDGDGPGPGFDSLRPHEDESLLSLTIALNDQSEYDGGGLYIHSTGDLLNGDAGTVLCFPGQLVHGGYPVTRGTRWILTVFLYVDANESGKPAGYTLDAIRALQKQQQHQSDASQNYQ